jgi:Cys-Gly metallodipeptidase DUG1
MGSFLESQLKQYGVETKSVDLDTHTMDGHSLKLPPVVLGRIGDDKTKKTILLYGHFDVQPVRHLPRDLNAPLSPLIIL